MKYLVVSDNHGNRKVVKELVEKYRGKVDGMFHCGDSELDSSDSLWDEMAVVTGNCDFDDGYKRNEIIDMGNDRVYLVHGHFSNVRFSLNQLFEEAKEVGATIALYGHTHVFLADYRDNILFVNPGSICFPRGRVRVKTYAIIESNESEFKVTFFDERHNELSNLQQTFKK